MIDIDQTLRMFSSKVDTFVKSSKSCDTVNIIEKALLVRDEFNKLNEWKFKFNKDQKLLFDNIHDRFGDSVLSFEIECECKKKVK